MTVQNNNLQRNKEWKRSIPIKHTLSHGCPMFWDIAITIRYPEWSQLSIKYPGNVQVSTRVRFYKQNENCLK